jgi:hypothetical protein
VELRSKITSPSIPLLSKEREGKCCWILVAAFLLLAGCCASSPVDKTETVIKNNEVRVPVPVIEESLEAKDDTVFIHGEKIIETDTVITVKYFPIEKKIYLKVKPDTVIINKVDTIQVTQKTEVVKAPGFFEKEFWYIAGFLFLLIILFIAVKIKI